MRRSCSVRFVLAAVLALAVFTFAACQEPIVPNATPVVFDPTPAAEAKDFEGGEGRPTPVPFIPDAGMGESLFVSKTCSGCHYVDRPDPLVGPSLQGIYEQAPSRKIGYSAEDYIVESIRQPAVYLVDGFSNLMTAFSRDQISDEELQHLLAYLETVQ